ncbi:glutamate receptor 1-like [Dermacentor variabilis]|uniref:glutamate receptor 1-like n=1 Tax=Dermacentor variabilis TaxID=34621 RepID=UPI003F5B4E70
MFFPKVDAPANASIEQGYLRVVYQSMFPFIVVTQDANGHRMSGPVAEMLALIIRGLNVRPVLSLPPDGQWGYKVNGSFTGAIGMLQRKEVDLFIGPAGLIAERLEAANFYPYVFGYSTILAPHPRKIVDPFSFVNAFQSQVWLAIFLSWFLVALVSTLGESLLSTLAPGRGISVRRGGYWNSLWGYLQFMLPQGCNKCTSSEFGRVLLGFWFLAMLVLMSSLGGELKGSLLVKDIEDHVDSVDDLLRFPSIRISAEKGSVHERFFNRPAHPTFRSLLPRLQPVRGSLTSMEVAAAILDKVEARSHVFVLPLTYLKGLLNARYTDSEGRCRFHVVRHPLSLTTVGMFHRKDLAPDTREAIEKRARYMIDSHLFERMIDTRVINYTRCLQEEEDRVDALSIGDVHGVFYLYLAGVCTSLIGFGLELVAYALSPRESKRRKETKLLTVRVRRIK